MTPTWKLEQAILIRHLLDASVHVREVHKNPKIWHRVRQSTQRALEQLEVALKQISEQEVPL